MTIIVQYDTLFHVNLVSKMMQIKTLSVDSASRLVDSTQKYLLSYQENGFKDVLCKAKELVEEMCVTSEFSEIRFRRKCQLFSYEPEAQSQGEKRFRTEFFNVALVSAIMSLESCFELLSSFTNTFGFLCYIKKIATLSADDVTKLCSNLKLALKTNDGSSTELMELILVVSFKAFHIFYQKRWMLCRPFSLFMKNNFQWFILMCALF
jgi:hypothetical protein